MFVNRPDNKPILILSDNLTQEGYNSVLQFHSPFFVRSDNDYLVFKMSELYIQARETRIDSETRQKRTRSFCDTRQYGIVSMENIHKRNIWKWSSSQNICRRFSNKNVVETKKLSVKFTQ